jgi:PKD repeat protein
MSYLRNGLRKLNDGIRSVASEFPNVVVVPPADGFKQHRWCAADPWVYGPSIRTSDTSSPAPFHPTPDGQQALANAIADKLADERHISTGDSVPADFPNGIHLWFANVTTAGAAFFNLLSGTSAAAAARSATAASETFADAVDPAGTDGTDLPPPTNFSPIAYYSVGSSAEYSGGVDITLPSQGAGALYQLGDDGAWHQVSTTLWGTDFVAHLDSLSPLALGNPAPEVSAAFSVNGSGGTAPSSVTFDASTSSVTSGTIASYDWDFGDGTTGTGPTPTHIYTASGTYTVRLRVASDAGSADVAQAEVAVTNAPPSASITGPRRATVNAPVRFNAAGSSDPNGHVQTVTWDFGDGTKPSSAAAGAAPTHTFRKPGTYNVRLTATDDEGANDDATLAVVVTAQKPPTVTKPAPAVRLGAVVRRDRHGRLKVLVRCLKPYGACSGKVTLSAAKHGKRRLIGTARFALAEGQTKRVRVKPRRKVRRLAKHIRKVSVKATVAAGLTTTRHCRVK